jgi:hypothetical protein
MPSIRTISDIKANLLRPATTSHFEVEIPIIPALNFWKGADKQGQIQLLCSEASLPGSNLATFDINNDRMGVTEKHVHRRIFDDRIDLTFYVDAGIYKPIQFFEEWIDYITSPAEDGVEIPNAPLQKEDSNYFYRMRYPQGEGGYIANQGLKVIKFEKDQSNGGGALEYKFVNVFPLAINSMPVSYEASSLLKCTVSMSYIRYIVKSIPTPTIKVPMERNPDPIQQAQQNSVNILPAADIAGGLVNSAVDRLTGNDFLGDVAGGLTAGFWGSR